MTDITAQRSPLTVYAALTLSALFWGSGFAVIKFALRSVTPLQLLAGTSLFAALAEILWCAGRGRMGRLRLPADLLWPVLALGMVGQTILNGLTFLGLEWTTATNAALLYAFSPVLIGLFATMFLREAFGPRKLLGYLVGFLGVAVIITQGRTGTVQLHGVMLGNLVVFGGAVYWAVYSVATRGIAQRISAEAFTFYLLLLGAVGPMAWDWAREKHFPLSEIGRPGLAAMAFMGIATLTIAMNFWNWGLERIPASRVGVFSYLEPVFASFVALTFLGEKLTAASGVGAALVFAGIYFSVRKPQSEMSSSHSEK